MGQDEIDMEHRQTRQREYLRELSKHKRCYIPYSEANLVFKGNNPLRSWARMHGYELVMMTPYGYYIEGNRKA